MRSTTSFFAAVLIAGCWVSVSAIQATPVAAQVCAGAVISTSTLLAPDNAALRAYLMSGVIGGSWNNGNAGLLTVAPAPVVGLSSEETEVKYTLLGDANLDGLVNGDDFTILAGDLGKAISGWDKGAFNYSGLVNGDGFTALVGTLGVSANGDVQLPAADIAAIDSFAAANGLTDPVPEPASLGLLAISTLGILSRRRSRN